ncbi:MAG: TolC family protein [Dysgonamonadaceae bacterium]|nr:TolC family protein [Dysgonamonadaceae bacterium]
MNRICFIIILCCFSLTGMAQQTLTLEQCIEIALENNRNIKQQELSRQSREIAYNQARADLLPNLNASAGQSFNFGRSIGMDNTYQNVNSSQMRFGLNSDITIFDGLRLKRNIDARRADIFASQADLEKLQDDIIISVSSAFLQVLLNKELLHIAENQTGSTKENIAQRRKLVEEGRLAPGEIFELEAQLAREEMNRVQAESNLKLAMLDLAQIMEMDRFDNFNITAPAVEELINEGVLLSSAAVFESALVNRPEIRGAQFRLQSREQELLMSKSQRYPSLSFGASMGTNYFNMSGRENAAFGSQLRNNMSNSVGLNVRIPIFNRFQVRNNVSNATLAVENSRIEIDKAKNELRKRIEQAYFNAVGAQSRWAASKKSETASREAFRFVEQKFESGRANSFELSLAKTNLAQVLAEQAQAKYEFAFRIRILELLKD